MTEAYETHLAVRRGCGFMPRQDLAVLDVLGSEARKLLHSLLSNEVANLQVGSGNLAQLLTPKGKVVAEVKVYALENAVRLVVGKAQFETLKKNIAMRIFRADVQIKERSNLVVLEVCGKKSPEALKTQGVKIESLEKEYDNEMILFQNQEAFIAREHQTGDIGYELHLNEDSVEHFCNDLMKNDATAFNKETFYSLTLEAGAPIYGLDYTEENFSLEANLNKAVSISKGCYLGQEPVARLFSRGHVTKRLAGLVLAENHPVPAGSKVFFEDREIGSVTRSGFAPSLQCFVALAFLRYDFLEKFSDDKKTVTVISSAEKTVAANLEHLPFYKEGGISFLAGGPQPERVIAPQSRTVPKI